MKYSTSFLDLPRITIVTPSYNQGSSIEQTIKSIIMQNYPNLEYIIIDGGSTDGTVDIIRKYQLYLTYWVTEKDNGQSHAINKGWRRATGELVTWLNSDDYLEDGALQRVAQVYKDHQNEFIGLIYGRAKVISAEGETLATIGEPFDLNFCIKNLVDPMPQPSTFIVKGALDEVGFLDENLHYALDLDLFLRLSLVFNPVFVNEVWSVVRYTSETKTSQNPRGFLQDHIIMLEKLDSNSKYGEQIHPLKSAAYTSNYLRSARINLEAGRVKEALYDLSNALASNPGFMARKIINTALHGRFREL